METRLKLSYDYSIPVTQSLFLLYGKYFVFLPYCFRNIKHDCSSSTVFPLMKVHRIVELAFCHISRGSIEHLINKSKYFNKCLISERDECLIHERDA